MPRMATSGALTMGVKPVPPMPPSELIDMQPPSMSLIGRPRPRAFSDSAAMSAAIWATLLLSQSRTTPTTSPRGVSIAMPMWKYFFSTRFLPVASSEALNCGKVFRPDTSALAKKASGESLGRSGCFAASSLRSASSARDVGVVLMRDMRNREPVARQKARREALDARQRLDLDLAEGGEVDRGPGRQAGTDGGCVHRDQAISASTAPTS